MKLFTVNYLHYEYHEGFYEENRAHIVHADNNYEQLS